MSNYALILDSGFYKGNLQGEVFSKYKNTKSKGRALKTKDNGHGYKTFNAYLNGKSITLYVHRFIWCYFNGVIPSNFEINHINANKSDNRLLNLEAVTRLENMQHAKDNYLTLKPDGHAQGEKNGRAALTEEQVRNIQWRIILGERPTSLAREYKVGSTAIYDIKSKKSWGHLWVN